MSGRPRLIARVDRDGERVRLLSPGVGYLRGAPPVGARVFPGASVGELEVLGVVHALEAPAGATGVVVERAGALSRAPVDYGAQIAVLDPRAGGAVADAEAPAAAGLGDLLFLAPTSGRFYRRPGPDQAPFVAVGDVLEAGRTICLLEVMKTFNRVTYGAAGLPARARVTAVLPEDGADLDRGQPILELEPA